MAARRLFCCFVLVLLVVCPALPAQTASLGYAGCLEKGHLRHWPHFPLRIYFAPGVLNSPDRLKQVEAGFDEWVEATSGVVCYCVVAEEAGADIVVSISSQLVLPKDARSLGQTVLNFDDAVMTRATLQLVPRDDDPAQFQEICAHEFGHALGIDGHSDDPHDMMYPVLSHPLLQAGNPEIDGLYKPGGVTPRDVSTLAAANRTLLFPAKKH